MHKKSLIIFVLIGIFFVITVFLSLSIKIDYYEKALIMAYDGQSKIMINQKIYRKLLNKKYVNFKTESEYYHKEIRNISVENNQYYCIVDYLQEFENQIKDINLEIKKQTIFGF